MNTWTLIKEILRLCHHPPAPNLRDDEAGDLYWDALTKTTIISGNPGTGKTVYEADQLVKLLSDHPESGALILDASGALKKALVSRIMSLPDPTPLLKRLVVNVLGSDPVKPQPEFCLEYGVPFEDQVNRVSNNLMQLNPEIVERAILGGVALDEIGKHLFRLLCAVVNQHGENFQVTEAGELLASKDKLREAVNTYGGRVPGTKAYFEREFLKSDAGKKESDLRTYTLRHVLTVLDTREARATLGYYKPAYTMAEMDERGLIVIVSGERILNQEKLMGHLMVQQYSLFMQHINRREADDPANKRLLLVVDELPWLLKYSGMSQQVANIASWYRSRNVTLTVIVQSLSQLSEDLLARMWTFGNHVCFSMENWDEALEVARQYFQYDPRMVKQEPAREGQNPITEPLQGVYDQYAYFVQRLRHRECVVKRYVNEQTRDPWIRHVRRTRDLPPGPTREKYLEVMDQLIRDRAVSIRDALEVVNRRELKIPPKGEPKPPTVNN